MAINSNAQRRFAVGVVASDEADVLVRVAGAAERGDAGAGVEVHREGRVVDLAGDEGAGDRDVARCIGPDAFDVEAERRAVERQPEGPLVRAVGVVLRHERRVPRGVVLVVEEDLGHALAHVEVDGYVLGQPPGEEHVLVAVEGEEGIEGAPKRDEGGLLGVFEHLRGGSSREEQREGSEAEGVADHRHRHISEGGVERMPL